VAQILHPARAESNSESIKGSECQPRPALALQRIETAELFEQLGPTTALTHLKDWHEADGGRAIAKTFALDRFSAVISACRERPSRYSDTARLSGERPRAGPFLGGLISDVAFKRELHGHASH
jgi:hypothetical protein